jgi:predicted permease
MSWLRFFHRAKRTEESSQEIQFYLDTETEENVALGMSPDEARNAARRKLGNPALIREDIYRKHSLSFLETAWQDFRYASRTMRRSRAFTLTSVLTLAVGIGGTTAMFTIIRAVLLKPLPFGNPDRLVYLTVDHPQKNQFDMQFRLSRLKLIRAAHVFAGIGAFGVNPESMTLSGRGKPEALRGARVSANLLNVLGVAPLLGRGFLPEDDAPNGPPVVMISADLWSRRYDRDPNVIGKAATLDARSYTIVGVLPPGFDFPFPGVDVWFSKPSEWSVLPSRYWDIPLVVGVGRLKPNVSLQQAHAALAVVDRQYQRVHPRAELGEMRLIRLKDRLVRNLRPMLWVLFGAVGFVLLIACANIAGLLLARSATRAREFAVRAAVGAARLRLIRQLLVESLVLAFIGGALGILLAEAALTIFKTVPALSLYSPRSLHIPGSGKIGLDLTVLAFAFALCFISGIVFGLLPSLQLSRPDLTAQLRESGAAAGQGSSAHRKRFGVSPRALLVVGQIALCVVLLIGAGLLMRSLSLLENVSPGFDPSHLLTMRIALPPARYNTGQKKAAFFDDLVQRVEIMAGVRSAAVAMSLPTTSWIRTNIMQVEGRPALNERKPLLAVIQSVTPSYFRTLGIPLLRGRAFTAHDNSRGAPPVVIINEALARRLWPDYPNGPSPIGQHLSEGFDKKIGWLRIVGIAANIHEGGLASHFVPEFYVPCAVHPPQTAYLAIRTLADPLPFANDVRSQVHAIDPDQSVSEVKPMNAVLGSSLGQRKTAMLLLDSFAGMALLLAVIGIYGTIAYSVSQRTHEFGIRQALGAQPSQIFRPVLMQGLGLSIAGIVIGIAGAFALTRLMKNLLFEIGPTDPVIFLGVSALFLAISLFASYVPAKRAAEIDPMKVLRIG